MPVAYNQSGYIGSSMSERAMEAYENGEAPRSKWSKTAMLATIEDYCYDNDYLIKAETGSVDMTPFEKMTKTDLFDKFFEYTSWHHTSKYANETDFFGLDEDELENTITDENFPENLPKPKKRKPKKRVSNRVNGLIPFAGLDENGTLYFYADKKKPKTTWYQGKCFERIFTVPLDGFDPSNPAPWKKIKKVARSIKRVCVTKSFSKIPVRSLCRWFEGLQNCREIDVSNLDISNVTNMNCMFRDCSSLTNIDALDNWDTSNVTNMSCMFYGCKKLTNLKAIANWDISKVGWMFCTFAHCRSLVSVDALANWDTSNVTKMGCLFDGCTGLTNLNALASLDTGSVECMRHMFDNCTSLTSVDALANWDTSKVVDMEFMFADCTSLENIDGLMGWDTSSVTDMSNMFLRCNKISKNNRQLLRKYWDITKK